MFPQPGPKNVLNRRVWVEARPWSMSNIIFANLVELGQHLANSAQNPTMSSQRWGCFRASARPTSTQIWSGSADCRLRSTLNMEGYLSRNGNGIASKSFRQESCANARGAERDAVLGIGMLVFLVRFLDDVLVALVASRRRRALGDSTVP